MAKKRPPKPPAADPHTALMAGDGAGLQPDRRATRAKDEEKPKKPRRSASAKRWDERLSHANKLYDKWEADYECKHLDDYYEGRQWRGIADDAAKKKYVINLVFATVESQLPALLFTKPKVKAEARPEHQQTDTSHAAARATLIEQHIQTQMDDPRTAFSAETDLSLRDAYARFAVIEVGYSADWIDNPNADKPILKEDGSPMLDEKDEPVTESKKMLPKGAKESLYVTRRDPSTFRASPGRNRLLSNDWVGYYEWLPIEDVKRNKEYQNTDDLQASGMLRLNPSAEDDETTDDETMKARVGQVKLWKIWDLRTKTKIVHADGHRKLLQEKAYVSLPLAVMKFYERRNAFYPLPPIYNWMSPQDEINESREMQKVHRRRALRRYMREPGVKVEEFEKLESAEDMLSIEVPKTVPPPIVPLADAPLDPQNWTELAASKDDLNQITGVTGEARNSPSAPTATQANIVNVRQSIRESRARQQVADWLGEIARLILLVTIERMKLPFMVKKTLDPFAMAQAPQQVGTAAQLWQEIEVDKLDGLDVDISIDVASLSPVAEDAQRQQWMTVLTILSSPAVSVWLITPNPGAPQDPSPMFRKTLMLNGITSDQEIREMWRVGQAIQAQMAQAAASQAALAKQSEPPKVSITFKGEDFANPAVAPIAIALLEAGQEGPLHAAMASAPESPLTSGNGNGSGGMQALPAPAGIPTGTPSKPPTMGG